MKQLLTILEMNEVFTDKCYEYGELTLEEKTKMWKDLKHSLVDVGPFTAIEDLEELNNTLRETHGWKFHQLLAYFDMMNTMLVTLNDS